MRKHYRIVSAKRFTIFIACCAALVLVMISSVSRISDKTDLNVYRSGLTHETSYTVCSGDTLWSIAEQCYGNDVDKRQLVYEIRNLNHLTDTSLYAGQQIRLPEK